MVYHQTNQLTNQEQKLNEISNNLCKGIDAIPQATSDMIGNNYTINGAIPVTRQLLLELLTKNLNQYKGYVDEKLTVLRRGTGGDYGQVVLEQQDQNGQQHYNWKDDPHTHMAPEGFKLTGNMCFKTARRKLLIKKQL